MRSATLLLLGLGVPLCAQGRQAAFVRVLGGDGQAVAGAKITCVGPPGVFDVDATADVVEVSTDARGRAQPRLLPQRRYAAFASASRAGGGREASLVRADVSSGRECVLQFAPQRPPTRVLIEGQDAWGERGPLRGFLRLQQCPGFAIALPDGELPPLPAGHVIEVRDRDGQSLWSSMGLGAATLREGGDLLAATLPPPQSLGCRVVDANGRPVADAVLWQAIEGTPRRLRAQPLELMTVPTWRKLGRTDAEGRCTVSLAVGVRDGRVTDDLCIEARRDGYAAGRAGTIANQSAFSGAVAITPADGVLPITMAEPEPIRVHPPAIYSMVVRGVTRGGNARSGQEGPVVVQTGADGKAQLPLPRDLVANRLAWIRAGDGPPGIAVVEPEPQGSFVMAPLRELRLKITDSLGGPARGQVVAVSAVTRDPFGCEVPMIADPAGKLPMRVGRGDWFVWCQDGASAAWRLIEDGTDDVDVALAMQPLPSVRFRVVDGRGQVRPGLAVNLVSSGYGEVSVKPSAEQRCLTVRQLLWFQELARAATTDAQGMLVMPALLPEASLKLVFDLGPDSQGKPNQRVVLARPGETVDVVIE